MGSLAQSLLRFLVDISSESLPTPLKEQLMTQATHCLLLLDHCSKGKLQVRTTIIIFVLNLVVIEGSHFILSGPNACVLA